MIFDQIPILIIPCEFGYNVTNNIKIFIKHISDCNKCEIVNNNNLFPSIQCFDDSLIGFVKEKKIKNLINAYHSLIPFYIERYYPHILLYIINDKKCIYNKCCFIIWYR